MGKRRNLKKRDNEGEGADFSDCTSNADTDIENGGTYGVQASNVNQNQNLIEGLCTEQGLSDNGDFCNRENSVIGDNVMGDNFKHNYNTEMGQALKEMTTAIVDTIRQSNSAITQGLGDLMTEVKGRLDSQGHVQLDGASHSRMSKRSSSTGVSRHKNKRYVVNGSNSSSDESGILEVRQRTHRVSVRERTRLPAFTGKETWKVWFNRFSEVADRFRWTDEDRLDELLPRLQGDAGDFVFGQLQPNVRQDYTKLIGELNNRFRVIRTAKTFGAQFSRRCQKQNESVEEFSLDLKRLYDSAYAERDPDTRREDLLRRFLDGLYDDKARFQVEFVKEPSDIDEAVFQVVAFQETKNRSLMVQPSSDRGMKRSTRKVKCDSTDCDIEDKVNVQGVNSNRLNAINNMGSKVVAKGTEYKRKEETESDKYPLGRTKESIDKTLAELMRKIDEINRRISGERKNLTCYECGNSGHFKRECPTLNANHAKKQGHMRNGATNLRQFGNTGQGYFNGTNSLNC